MHPTPSFSYSTYGHRPFSFDIASLLLEVPSLPLEVQYSILRLRLTFEHPVELESRDDLQLGMKICIKEPMPENVGLRVLFTCRSWYHEGFHLLTSHNLFSLLSPNHDGGVKDGAFPVEFPGELDRFAQSTKLTYRIPHANHNSMLKALFAEVAATIGRFPKLRRFDFEIGFQPLFYPTEMSNTRPPSANRKAAQNLRFKVERASRILKNYERDGDLPYLGVKCHPQIDMRAVSALTFVPLMARGGRLQSMSGLLTLGDLSIVSSEAKIGNG